MKMLYNVKRPYLVNDGEEFCCSTWANPSDTSLTSMALGTFIAIDYIKSRTDKFNDHRNIAVVDEMGPLSRASEEVTELQNWKRILLLFGVASYAILMGVFRYF